MYSNPFNTAASTTNITKTEELSDLSNQKDSKIADPAVT